MPLNLLHLSDIHFKANQAWDEDRDILRELVLDLEDTLSDPVDAILIGGDIAFSGQAEEYLVATEWIARVRAAVGGVDVSRVWTVPGNHDVDRAAAEGISAMKFRLALERAGVSAVDAVMKQWLADDPNSDALIGPLAHYNEFARQYLCPTSTRSLSWGDDTLTVDSHRVDLIGINSVINSGPSPDPMGHLVVGKYQSTIPRRQGHIRIAMLHHPPRWIKDWSIVQPYLDRAHLVLFGHEHAAATQRTAAGTVHVSAGAVAPERTEDGETDPWLPTYNVIKLGATDNQLEIGVRTRRWSIVETRFVDTDDQDVELTVEIDRLDGVENQEPKTVMSDSSPLIDHAASGSGSEVTQADAARRLELRRLAVQFVSLPPLDRVAIANDLGVWEDSDQEMAISERSVEWLERIRAAGLISELQSQLRR